MVSLLSLLEFEKHNVAMTSYDVLQCIQRESAVVYLAKEVPWDYGNLYPQKWLPSKSISLGSLYHCWVQWRGETLFSDHSNALALSINLKNARGKETLTQQPFIIPKDHSLTNSFRQALKLSGGSSSHCPNNPQNNIPTLSCGDSLATSDRTKQIV